MTDLFLIFLKNFLFINICLPILIYCLLIKKAKILNMPNPKSSLKNNNYQKQISDFTSFFGLLERR